MARFVIAPDVAIELARTRSTPSAEHQLLAPTLLRSEVLAALYASVRAGVLEEPDAFEQLGHIRGLKVRLLGDRVLQQVAWKIAKEMGWTDTRPAEYLALTQLQADAFVTLDGNFASASSSIVRVASLSELIG